MEKSILVACFLTFLATILTRAQVNGANLNISVYDFEFENDGDRDAIVTDFIGMDVIDNRASTNATQKVVHRKLFEESFSFSQNKSWEYIETHDFNVNIGFSMFGVGIGLDFSFQHTKSHGSFESSQMSTSREQEIISSRQIEIPPFTEVQVCSTMSSNNAFVQPFTSAKIRHTSDNLTVKELSDLISRNGYTNLQIEGASVITQIQGSIAGTMSLSSRFFVTPNEHGGMASCMDLKEKFRERNKLSDDGKLTREKREQIELEIQNVIRNMRKYRK